MFVTREGSLNGVQFKGLLTSDVCPHALVKGLILASLTVWFIELPLEGEAEGQAGIFRSG